MQPKGQPNRDPLLADGAGHDGRAPNLVDVGGISEKEKRDRTVLQRNASHCTLCRLNFRKHITDLQLKAGERLQDDHAKAGLASIPGAKLEVGGCIYGPIDICDIKIDASKRMEIALMAVGTSGRFLLKQVVLEDMTLEKVSQMMRVKKNAVLPALRVVLDALAAHYGLSARPGDREQRSRIRFLRPFHGA